MSDGVTGRGVSHGANRTSHELAVGRQEEKISGKPTNHCGRPFPRTVPKQCWFEESFTQAFGVSLARVASVAEKRSAGLAAQEPSRLNETEPQRHSQSASLVSKMTAYATLFATGHLGDAHRAELRLSEMIGQLHDAGDRQGLEQTARVLHDAARMLCQSENPNDPVLEVLFRLLMKIHSHSSTDFLLETLQWKPENRDYLIVREMAAEALAVIGDPRNPCSDENCSRSARSTIPEAVCRFRAQANAMC